MWSAGISSPPAMAERSGLAAAVLVPAEFARRCRQRSLRRDASTRDLLARRRHRVLSSTGADSTQPGSSEQVLAEPPGPARLSR